MIRAAVLDAGVDLRGLLAAIAEHGIQFRVNEESGSQVIWVHTQEDADKVVQALARWQQLRAEGVIGDLPSAGGNLGAYFPLSRILREIATAFVLAPVTALLILAAVLVALFSSLGSDLQPVRDFFYPAFVIGQGGSAVLQLLGQIDSPRLFVQTLTPALLHFGAIHLVFNSLWIWHFGRMIERAQPSLLYLVVVLWIAFFSNATQYLWTLTSNFGGLSGVVYGLLGYIWMWQLLLPYGRLRLPPAMIGVLLLALVLMEVLASSWIASAAHAGGLVAGMLAGLLTAGITRLRR
ncbi:MAG: rhomboid family intramembrane serine protease [Pseudomonadales bacterium]|nr:rhomboid family intramembrane serine protease [Pseudomonadales bacterium]MCP5331441.1 rhomboid family intramembrane serine protease [Pseudomonadales bacterium]MCP5344816.1 rhomboid family intramembrane serine protease [Pseudomonadales bacterium]